MALVAILTGIIDFYMILPWMATRAIPTSPSFAFKLYKMVLTLIPPYNTP